MTEARYTLLVVDDEPDVVELLRKMLEQRFEVLTALSAAEALAILQTRPVDVLITDQRMPEMTGIELVAAARRAGVDVTAILLAGFTDPEELIAAINGGQIFRYVTKPWDVRDLLVTVGNAVEVTRLRRDKERLVQQLHKRVEALSVLYEVSQRSAGRASSYDALIDNVLSGVCRVLPYDCGVALVVEEGQSASLRLRCNAVVSDTDLLWLKDTALAEYRRQSGLPLPEEQVIVRVVGSTTPDAAVPGGFASQIGVTLVAEGRLMGTLSLFARRPAQYSAGDSQLLDTLANQTTGAILALRAAEEEARSRIERMVESMADGVLLMDQKSRILVLNPAARRMLRTPDEPERWGAHLRDTLGLHPFELVRGWEYGGARALRQEVEAFGRTLQSTVTPVMDARGNLSGVCVVLQDVTERRQLERRKEEFISIVSHELRTPLTSITGALDVVLNRLAGDINEKQRRYLAMAKESTGRLNAIVDDLLDLSQISKGRLRMSFELTCLDELVGRAIEKHGPAFAEKRLRVTSLLPASPLRALADPSRLEQVLFNLLGNAIKFTPEGGEVRVELQATPHLPGFISLRCWNSGEEIAEADLERIFEQFELARSERTRTLPGTGLGLAICRSIVEAHSGQIWAEPTTAGVQVVAVLPVEPVGDILRGDPEPQEQPAAGGNVLVVEDDPDLGYVLKGLLRARGHRVHLSRSAEDATGKARRYLPDVVVLDEQLSGPGGGLALAEHLRHDLALRGAGLLVISERDERRRAFHQGASAFLLKPLRADKLLAVVDALAMHRRAQEPELSPTTQLPGSGAFEREVQRRLEERAPFAFCYLDLDNLKAYNDCHGFAKADGVVRQTGDLLREVFAQVGMPGDFLGHVAGHDFAFITDARSVDAICQRVIEVFDRIIPLYYDRPDRERGYIEVEDRQGERRRFPIMSVSIVAVMCDGMPADHAELARRAAELQRRAKAIQGSVYLRSDREQARSIA